MAEQRPRGERETVEFSIKGPVSVNIHEEQISPSGCSVVDLHFATPSQVGEVNFRNYYTVWLTLLVKMKMTADQCASGTNIGSLPAHNKEDNLTDWLISVPRKVLMRDPHHETGSHDMVSICCTESSVEWKDLVAMRLILRQPSPVWRTFLIEEINVFKDLPRRGAKESEAEALSLLIKKQTLDALRWAPVSEGQGQTGAYEFTSLPLP